MDTLDAHLPTNETQIDMQWQIYDALLGWDPQHKLVMQLAESYEKNADATQHTVKLRSGLTFVASTKTLSQNVRPIAPLALPCRYTP